MDRAGSPWVEETQMTTAEIAKAVQMLSGPVWLVLLIWVLQAAWLLLMCRARTRVNIDRFKAWDRAAQDMGVSEQERHKLFGNAARRDLKLRDAS